MELASGCRAQAAAKDWHGGILREGPSKVLSLAHSCPGLAAKSGSHIRRFDIVLQQARLLCN
jgi:hypothetical protein